MSTLQFKTDANAEVRIKTEIVSGRVFITITAGLERLEFSPNSEQKVLLAEFFITLAEGSIPNAVQERSTTKEVPPAGKGGEDLPSNAGRVRKGNQGGAARASAEREYPSPAQTAAGTQERHPEDH